eukprot:NODE_8646_length_659_cov_60.649254_g8021_i0.p1 GENE.NODE_8646_length_659_cov_60.649254_g8021_i0~~NODE_8646_length_659_cov_60.649254_g8021_i0.p1  ORF type:complete len:178 (-),score=32.77 NODE_8646_length_659_cov_60.649254_g8021_i0:74-607(-)
MPSYTAWTLGTLAYFGWIMKVNYETRMHTIGISGQHAYDQYHTKHKQIWSKKLMEKYNEELSAVDEENITPEDVEKFGLDKSTNTIQFWSFLRQHPYWQNIVLATNEEAYKEVISEHPVYEELYSAYQQGGKKALYWKEGPWMKHNFDNGLHGYFQGYRVVKSHHGHDDSHSHDSHH